MQARPTSAPKSTPWRRYSPVFGKSRAPSARAAKISTPDMPASPITIVM